MNIFPFEAKVKSSHEVPYDPGNPEHVKTGFKVGDTIWEPYYRHGLVLSLHELADATVTPIKGDKTYTDSVATTTGLYVLFAELVGDSYILSVEHVSDVRIEEKNLNEYIRKQWQSISYISV